MTNAYTVSIAGLGEVGAGWNGETIHIGASKPSPTIYVGLTGRQMCEVIEWFGVIRRGQGGPLLTAKEIWNSSPTGELFHIFEWFFEVDHLISVIFALDSVDRELPRLGAPE